MAKILITGITGMIGGPLSALLRSSGNEVVGLSRNPTAPDSRIWDPTASQIDPEIVSGYDVIVHLTGENIGSGRWTTAKKQKIRASRVHSTRILSEAIAQSQSKPRLFVSASAVGYYGSRGSDILTETHSAGAGFLAGVTRDWEEATAPAVNAGVRVIHPRTGPTINSLLAKMLLPFKLGLGGVVGSGDQYLSWVTLDDVVGAIDHLMAADHQIHGAVNIVAPNPVTNREFTKTLAGALHRPAVLPLPAFAARIVLGEMAEDLVLVSQRASAKKLTDSGYVFRFAELRGALHHALHSA